MTEEDVAEDEEIEEELGYGEPFDVSVIAKALVLFGLMILAIYLVLRYLAVTSYADDMWMDRTILGSSVFEGVVTVSVIFIFFGLIAYMIHLQFMKLALIAEEVLQLEDNGDQLEEERSDLTLEDSG
ncbi:MAG: hypothetical protein KAW09_04375 [Thermoplasmata archaeon]|nr:hypothetical protein [Thermoplasmata archaeon]